MDKVDVFVEEETRKILYAFSVAALWVAKANGIDIYNKEALRDHAKNIQKQWKDGIDISKKEALRDQATNIKNQWKDVGINYVSDKRCPNYQNNAFCLLEDIISDQSREVSIFGGQDTFIKKPTTSLKNTEFFMKPEEECDKRGTAFVKDIIELSDKLQRKSPKLLSDLHETLYDEGEHSKMYSKKQMSEDSGFISTENSEEARFIDVKSVSPASDKLKSLLGNIQDEIDSNVEEIVVNWKGSIIEHAFSIICEFSKMGAENEEVVRNFVFDLLQDIWWDDKFNQLKWSQQISVIKKLVVTPPLCQEVISFIVDKIDNVINFKRDEFGKLVIFFSLIDNIVETLNNLQTLDKIKQCKERQDVTKLWQERFSILSSDSYDQDLIQGIKNCAIPKLEIFLTSMLNTQPIMSLATSEVLKKLNSLRSENPLSQDSQTHTL